MKILFLQPPMGAWVTWGNHCAINVSHVQMAACVRRDAPGAEVEGSVGLWPAPARERVRALAIAVASRPSAAG